MFQTFVVETDPSHAAPRIAALREAMREAGIDAYLVPRADEHQGEYVPPRAERLKWLTGFTGSAGMALILLDRAILFVDGRYTLQARTQCDAELFEIADLVETPPAKWIGENGQQGWPSASTPGCTRSGGLQAAQGSREARCHGRGGGRQSRRPHLGDQPVPPSGTVEIHPERLAGRKVADKLADLSAAIEKAGASHCVLTDPSSLAWAFNIRGSDVAHTPLALGFAILAADGPIACSSILPS
jgi:Xaa-Pro aminopeptidase